MTEKAKPTPEQLARRVEALEEALGRMLGAFQDELAALREDLRRLDESARHDAPTRPPQRPVKPEAAKRTVSEELALTGKKKDPRADD